MATHAKIESSSIVQFNRDARHSRVTLSPTSRAIHGIVVGAPIKLIRKLNSLSTLIGSRIERHPVNGGVFLLICCCPLSEHGITRLNKWDHFSPVTRSSELLNKRCSQSPPPPEFMFLAGLMPSRKQRISSCNWKGFIILLRFSLSQLPRSGNSELSSTDDDDKDTQLKWMAGCFSSVFTQFNVFP